MDTITFNCRFITPTFLGGADPKGTPELRGPSLKGALRFWWRAQGGISEIKKLRERELEIFGGVDSSNARRASFTIRVSHQEFITGETLPESRTSVRNKNFKVNIFEYLAYGIYDQKERKLNRNFVQSGQQFQVKFSFSSANYKSEVLSAFRSLSLFGGIGTKSRNGYGKFEILNDREPSNWMDVLKQLKVGNENSFTSFSDQVLCFQTSETFDNAEQAIAEVGKAYKNAREFIEDPHFFEHRSYIASPIVENKRQKSFLDRHTKPYFLTAVPESGEFRGLILYMPYLFLEDAKDMMKELYNEKAKRPQSTGIRQNELEQILIHTSISTHQKNFHESNGYFHSELCHHDNPHALTQVQL